MYSTQKGGGGVARESTSDTYTHTHIQSQRRNAQRRDDDDDDDALKFKLRACCVILFVRHIVNGIGFGLVCWLCVVRCVCSSTRNPDISHQTGRFTTSRSGHTTACLADALNRLGHKEDVVHWEYKLGRSDVDDDRDEESTYHGQE